METDRLTQKEKQAMQLISINLGEERALQYKDHVEQTGIFKFPTNKPVQVTKLGEENYKSSWHKLNNKNAEFSKTRRS